MLQETCKRLCVGGVNVKIELSKAKKEKLEVAYKKERDGRIRDRMKAFLLRSEGWKQVEIAQALRLRAETVEDHLREYVRLSKLKPDNGGSESKLNEEQTTEIVAHLEKTTYLKVVEICAHIQNKYDIKYTKSGMTKWLHNHGFSLKNIRAHH